MPASTATCAVQVLMLMATEEKSDATLFAMQQAQHDQLQDQLQAMDVSLALDAQHIMLSAAPAHHHAYDDARQPCCLRAQQADLTCCFMVCDACDARY